MVEDHNVQRAWQRGTSRTYLPGAHDRHGSHARACVIPLSMMRWTLQKNRAWRQCDPLNLLRKNGHGHLDFRAVVGVLGATEET